MDENKHSSLSQATNLEQMGEFWDTHDFTDVDTDAPDVAFTVSQAVQIEADLLALLEKQAHLRGISVETLINLWLQQKLAEEDRWRCEWSPCNSRYSRSHRHEQRHFRDEHMFMDIDTIETNLDILRLSRRRLGGNGKACDV